MWPTEFITNVNVSAYKLLQCSFSVYEGDYINATNQRRVLWTAYVNNMIVLVIVVTHTG